MGNRGAYLTSCGWASWWLQTLAVALCCWGAPGSAHAADTTVPGAITSYTTIECAGFEWRIEGDDDFDCGVTVEYRKAGETPWRAGQPLLRVETGLWHHGEDPGNLLAGSLFFLEPLTTYEVRLTLSDPDGGSAQQFVTVTTRGEPRPAADGRVRFVQPGSGGGTGTEADPFRGLAAADAAAEPGDIFVVKPGTYSTKFVPTKDGTVTRPIVYLGSDRSSVILDGNGGTNSNSNCVDLTNRRYIFIENLTLGNCLRPLTLHNTVGIVIRGCTIEPIHQLLSTKGIYGNPVEDLYIADNTILMPGDWAAIGRTGTYGTGGYGVEVVGHDIILCYNTVVESWDGLGVGGGDGSGVRTYNVDIYNNFVDRASDDASQTDAVHANIRIFRNRFLNSGCSTSFQPSFGGPCYILYNEMFNTRIDPFKYHPETYYFGALDPQTTSGMIAMHNTNICSKAAWYESGAWRNVRHRNNLLLGARTGSYGLYVYDGQRGDLDYDGFNRQQTNLVKYNAVAYKTLPAFFAGAGQEQHGVEVALGEFVRGVWPVHPEWEWAQGYGTPYSPADFDLQLTAGSVAVDRGQVLPNINDGYAGASPDLGCYERGQTLPWYGPRPSVSLGVPGAPVSGGSGLQLMPPRPNPTTGAVACALLLDRPAIVSIRIVDTAGRVIWKGGEGRELPGGTHTIRWDGRNDSGTPARSGVYFVQVRSGSASLSRRIAVLY
jgi:hypothetical protein